MEELPKDVLNLLITQYFDAESAYECLFICKKWYQWLYDKRKILSHNKFLAKREQKFGKGIVLNTVHDEKTLYDWVQCSECIENPCIMKKKNFIKHSYKKHGEEAIGLEVINCNKCLTLTFPLTHKCPLRIVTCKELKDKEILEFNTRKNKGFSETRRCEMLDLDCNCTLKDVPARISKHINNECLTNVCTKCNRLYKLGSYSKCGCK